MVLDIQRLASGGSVEMISKYWSRRMINRVLNAATFVFLAFLLHDAVVFDLVMPARMTEATFRNQCRSLRPGMRLPEVEAVFDSDSFTFDITRKGETVEIIHRAQVCSVTLASGTDSVGSASLNEGGILWWED
jgi:hypothetical protein